MENFEQSMLSQSNDEKPVEKSDEPVLEQERERKSTSKRLLLAIEANLLPLVGKVTVEGTEHINEIPKGKKVVIMVSHISDLDVPLAVKALGQYFDIAVSDKSTHHSFSQDPAGRISIGLAGKDNFIPIDWKVVDGKKQAGFNADNFVAMADALGDGKEVIVVAHNPSSDGKLGEGGIGGVYLSQIADAIILPVAVNFKGEGFIAGKNTLNSIKSRPDVTVSIGEPIQPGHIEGIERYKEILDKRKVGQKLSTEDVAEFKELSNKLRNESDLVMGSIAAMLPEEKRGTYGQESLGGKKNAT